MSCSRAHGRLRLSLPLAARARLLMLLGAIGVAGCAQPPAHPSIVLVTLDTLRRDHVGAYGGLDGLTPHLDALARDGLVHESAFTTMPTTAPAHASLFTGLHPHEHGVRRNGVPLRSELQSSELAVRLRQRGYATAAFVTAKVLSRAATRFGGFDTYDEPQGPLRPGEDAVAAAGRWLASEHRRPVFLWVHLYDPHAPYGGVDVKRRTARVDPRTYGFVAQGRFARPEARERMAKRYAAGVRAADAALGKLLAEVRRRLHDPVVAVVADHGEALDEHLDARGYAYDHGEFLDDAEIRIALVVAGPGVAAGRSGTAVSIRDLYTTLLAVAGIEDADASAADRRDLRQPVAEPRTARIERRIVAPLELANFGPAARARIETHAVAASDGGRTVIVGEDGSLTTRPQPEAPELVAAARGYLRAVRGEPDVAGSEALDPALREALESLGYVRE